MNLGGGGSNNGAPTKRRIMVVADPGRESAGALQWALSHAVLEHDHLILLHVDHLSSSAASLRKSSTFSTYFRRASASINNNNNNSGTLHASASLNHHHLQQQSNGGGGSVGNANGEGDFLEAMRAKCEAVQPKVKVQIERVEMDQGRENKAAAILAQSLMLGVDLLVIGQRRTSSILSKLSGGTGGKDMAEFLIEHSKCLCVGVQKKGQNAGYLLNTKTHKNFWLLA